MIRSMHEFESTYLPESTERRRTERLTPEEWGYEVGVRAVSDALAVVNRMTDCCATSEMSALHFVGSTGSNTREATT